MNKPITVARHDFIQQVVDLVNNSGLPAFSVVDILKAVINQMNPLVEAQYKKDLEAYETSQAPEGEVTEDGVE